MKAIFHYEIPNIKYFFSYCALKAFYSYCDFMPLLISFYFGVLPIFSSKTDGRASRKQFQTIKIYKMIAERRTKPAGKTDKQNQVIKKYIGNYIDIAPRDMERAHKHFEALRKIIFAELRADCAALDKLIVEYSLEGKSKVAQDVLDDIALALSPKAAHPFAG